MWIFLYIICGLAVAEAIHNNGATKGAIRYWIYFVAIFFWPALLVYGLAFRLFSNDAKLPPWFEE